MPRNTNEAVRRALEALPVSRREVARRADLSHTTLNRIVTGDQRATPSQARAVAAALRELARECEQGAAGIIDAEGDAHE